MPSLKSWRQQLDKIDLEIMQLLAKRQQVVRQIGQLKLKQGLPIFQPEREQVVLQTRCTTARQLKLSESLIRQLWILIMNYSKKTQEKI